MDIDNFSIEQVLWSKVLRQAKEDLTYEAKPNEDEDYIRRTAKTWFKNDGSRPRVTLYGKDSRWDGKGCDPEIGSFPWICSILDLNPDAVRKSVLG